MYERCDAESGGKRPGSHSHPLKLVYDTLNKYIKYRKVQTCAIRERSTVS